MNIFWTYTMITLFIFQKSHKFNFAVVHSFHVFKFNVKESTCLSQKIRFLHGLYVVLAFDDQNMQITALCLLCCMLPIPNRDTLKVLLEFLAEVAQCSEDSIDTNGVEVSIIFWQDFCTASYINYVYNLQIKVYS